MIRQILGSVAQFEKAMLVSKLRGASARSARPASAGGARATSRSTPRRWRWPRSSRYPVNGRMRSLSEIAVALEAAGHVTRAGTRYAPAVIAHMVGR